MRLARMMLLGVMLGLPLSSIAGETWLMGSFASHHWKRNPDQNERNYGLFLDHSMSEQWSVVIGGYKNSQDRMSSVATVGTRFWRTRVQEFDVESRLLVGAISGYGKSEVERSNAERLILPALTVRGKDVGLIITGVPGVLLGFGLEFRLP